MTALATLRYIERTRREYGPVDAIARARAVGLAREFGRPGDRNRTKRIVAWLDRQLFPQPNCYRRVLLEISLSREAAGERVMMGFREGGGAGSGHAWLESDSPPESYEAVVSI